MKHVTIKRAEYEKAIYPAVALARPATTEDIRTALAVQSKLDDLGVQKPQTDTAKEQGLPALYVMVEDEARVSFEDAEAEWLKRTITKAIEDRNFITATAGLALAFRDRLEKAPGEIGQDGVSEERAKVAGD